MGTDPERIAVENFLNVFSMEFWADEGGDLHF
jgi:hypothetical protein